MRVAIEGDDTKSKSVNFGGLYFSNGALDPDSLADLEYTGEHTHTPGTEWLHDETQHWHVCTDCSGKVDAQNHTFGEWTVTKEATKTEKGSKERVCSVCGYKAVEEIPATGNPSTGDSGVALAAVVLLAVSGAALVLSNRRKKASL